MRIGIVGATGIVGQELISILAESSVKISVLRLSASSKSVGKSILTHLGNSSVQQLTKDFFDDLDLCFFCSTSNISQQWIPVAVQQGVMCVDNSSAFRQHADVPIIVPEVNKELLDSKPKIVSNPNCCVAQLVPVLFPLHTEFGLKEVSISTYQAVSGAGKKELEQLKQEARNYPNIESTPRYLFNVQASIGPHSQGHTDEERKIVTETRKIINHPELPMSVTAVRVAVLRGHGEAVSCKLNTRANIGLIEQCLAAAPNVVCIDLPTPGNVQHTNHVYVGRLRQNFGSEGDSISLWIMADNLRKGAAQNALNIAEEWYVRQ